ncbi:MAG: hypothetical protein KBA26_04115 [Candidatus Delongbacteria bacterium]|nr:hypothetical protein [Candidatus Delongbacteria bacterium]
MVLFLFFPVLVRSQEGPSKIMEDGWAIQLGAGFIYGGNLGILGERQILLKENFRLSPCVSLGVAEGGKDSTSIRYAWLGVSIGLMMEYGKKYRIIWGPQIVMNQELGNSVEVKKNRFPCYSFIVGYKRTSDFGLIWQVYIGDVYLPDPLENSWDYAHSSHVGIGIGYKL